MASDLPGTCSHKSQHQGGGSAHCIFPPYHQNNTSETDVAPWCYKWVDGMGWMDWIYPGGVKYRAPYGAKNS